MVFTDSIPYANRCSKVTQLTIADMFAETIRRVMNNESISCLLYTSYQGGPDYRHFFPDEAEMLSMPHPPKGVLGVTPGMIGCACLLYTSRCV